MPSRPSDRGLKSESLALYGGNPVRETWLPYAHHSISDDDIATVVDVLRSDWITQGPKIEEFENAVANYCGVKYGVVFSSGTAALHAACAAAGLRPGDEAITTPLTFVATANAIAYCGGRPVFADIDAGTLNISPVEIERRVTPRTRAIIPVDFAGLPSDLDAVREIAARHHLVVIEDAAHALGAEYRGRKIGSISDMTVFSFHPVKHITTGEGGMILTDQKNFAEFLRAFRRHGIASSDSQYPWRYQVSALGYNYRITDFQCVLGLNQFRKLELRLMKRREIAALYQEALSKIDAVSLPDITLGVAHAWHLFVVLLNLDRLSIDRDTVLQALRAENIGATLHYPLVHLHPFYREQFGYGEGLCPVAEAMSARIMSLPIFSAMTDGDVNDVVVALTKTFRFFWGS